MHVVRRCSVFLACVLSLGLAGCGGGSPTGTVSGKVTFKEQPVTAGQVTLHSKDGRPLFVNIQSDGTYTVKDVPYGEHLVTVYRESPEYRAYLEQVNTAQSRRAQGIQEPSPHERLSVPL